MTYFFFMTRRHFRKKNGYGQRILTFPVAVISAVFLASGIIGFACSGDSGNDPDIDDVSYSGHYAGMLDVATPDEVASQVKGYEGFRLSFNKDNKTPNWVAWELLGSEVNGEEKRSDNFWTDTEIEGCPSTYDYKGSGFDRGHMCPAADQKWSPKAMSDCFVMANMCPQDHSLNAGAWNTLENKERQWAQRDSAIVIVAGPIYEKSDSKRIGDAGVRVPGAFFKILAAPYAEQPRGIAFVYPNMSSPGSMQEYVLTIDEIEQLTGFDFLSSLPDEIENEIESKASFKEWNGK